MLEWNVYWEDFNSKQIVVRNVFNLSNKFVEYLKTDVKKFKRKEDFIEQLQKDLRYCYWYKSEYEVIITSWPSKEECNRKIDVYKQIMINWDKFAEYVWKNRKLIKNL